MAELTFAPCCGNCVHVSRPKNPSDTHSPHYEVAKTERWCYLHNWYVTRETGCEDFEENPKSGGIPACKRIFAFNRKAQEIFQTGERMRRLGVASVKNGNFFNFSIPEDNPYRIHGDMGDGWSYNYGPKDSKTTEYLKVINNYLDEIEKGEK